MDESQKRLKVSSDVTIVESFSGLEMSSVAWAWKDQYGRVDRHARPTLTCSANALRNSVNFLTLLSSVYSRFSAGTSDAYMASVKATESQLTLPLP